MRIARRFFVMYRIFKKVWQGVLVAIFPVFCVGCGQEGGVLCINCGQVLKWQKIELCPLCREESMGGKACQNCVISPLVGAVAGFLYTDDGLVGKLIKSYKYDYQDGAGREIGRLVSEQVGGMRDFFTSFDCVVPVPLHRRRFAERGFNQAETVAFAIESGCGGGVVVLKDCLKRIKNTPRQAGLGREERLANLDGAFVCARDVSGKKVLVVDDVLTTGTTLVECARVLRAAGAREVWGYTVARG
jgi:ComF family protein